MIKRFFVIMFLISFGLLAGCSTTPVVKVVTKKEQVYVKLPNALTSDISAPQPPDIGPYIKMSPEQREDVLTGYNNDLLNTLLLYKVRFKNIRDWDDKQSVIFTKNQTQTQQGTVQKP